MKKKIAFFAAALAVAMPLTTVLANEDTVSGGETEQSQSTTTESQREANKKAFEAQREQTKKAFEMQREQNKQAFEMQREQNKQAFEAKREEQKKQRCEKIRERLQEQLGKREENKQKFNEVFSGMIARLTRLSERLASKGIDVTKLNADIAILQTKIDDMKVKHETFVTGLKDAQAETLNTCETATNQGFLGKILGVRRNSSETQQARLDIKNFFLNTIKDDILAIRKQLEAKKTTATEEKETTPAPQATGTPTL